MLTNDANLIIRNARLIDGSGGPSVMGGLAVRDDRIVALGDVDVMQGSIEIDAGGKALAPGFIDVHTHDDRALLVDPLMTCKVSQGVTSVVTGNCGVSLAPLKLKGAPPPPLDLLSPNYEDFFASFGDYLSTLDKDPAAVNAVCQVGHSSLRAEAMDSLNRPASRTEIMAMRHRLEQALNEGAIGLSTGLFYEPARAAPTEEIIELAKSLREVGGMHTTHMRDEGDDVAKSLQEAFEIGAAADVSVVISHHKCAGTNNHGRSQETLALIEQARCHQPIGLDAYPYIAGSTVLNTKKMMGATRITITWSVPHPECAGLDLSDIAAKWNVSIHRAADRLQPAGAIYFMMDENDVQRILRYPHTMIGSDGLPHDKHPHPRLWGTFPRVLGHYVRDVGLFSLEEAVRKMTGLPASQFGMTNRGVLKVGAFADLVLFDPATVLDLATFAQPTTAAAGIDQVYVNGCCVWRDGANTGIRPGLALRLQDLGTIGE